MSAPDPGLIAVWLLALVIAAGVLLVGTITVRCIWAPVPACSVDTGLREMFAEVLVVLVALISRPWRDR